MSVLVLLAAGVLGGVGAVSRFLLDGAVSRRVGRDLPWGTLAVNASGAVVLGVLTGLALSQDTARIAGAGLVGGYTTFSTWALESHRLGEDGRRLAAAANFAVSLTLGVLGAWLGRKLGAL